MKDWFSLLTQLTQKFGFNSHGLKSNGLISSLQTSVVQRVNLIKIQQKFIINPTLIGSQLSLNVGQSWRTQDLAQKLLNSLTIWSKVKRRRENTSIFKGISAQKKRTVWFGEDRLMIMITCGSRATIPWLHDADPRSPLISPIRSWSDPFDASTCRKVSVLSHSFKRPIAHVSDQWSGGLCVHAIDTSQSHLTPTQLPHHLERRNSTET